MNRSFIFGFWCGRVFDSRSGFARGFRRTASPRDKAGCDGWTMAVRRFASIPFPGSVAGMCKSPGRYGCPVRKRSAAGRSAVVFGAKSGPEAGSLPVGQPACTEADASPIVSGGIVSV